MLTLWLSSSVWTPLSKLSLMMSLPESLDTGATIDLMPIIYAKAVRLEIKPLSMITDKHVTMRLAAGQYSEAVRYEEFNLKVPGVAMIWIGWLSWQKTILATLGGCL